MSNMRSLNYDLFSCTSEIERVDRELIRLRLYREKLVERRERLKQELQYSEVDQRPGNIMLKNQMAMNLLNGKDIY